MYVAMFNFKCFLNKIKITTYYENVSTENSFRLLGLLDHLLFAPALL